MGQDEVLDRPGQAVLLPFLTAQLAELDGLGHIAQGESADVAAHAPITGRDERLRGLVALGEGLREIVAGEGQDRRALHEITSLQIALRQGRAGVVGVLWIQEALVVGVVAVAGAMPEVVLEAHDHLHEYPAVAGLAVPVGRQGVAEGQALQDIVLEVDGEDMAQAMDALVLLEQAGVQLTTIAARCRF
jgi:hypothetical protein